MTDQTSTTLNVLEALHSTPARRYLSKKKIPDTIIWELLDAAIRAPSGGNSQGWNWMVLKDQKKKDQKKNINRLAIFNNSEIFC